MPDRPGAAGHQNRGVLDRPVPEYQVVRSQGLDAQAGAQLHRDAVGQRDRAVFRDHGPFGGGPPAAAARGEVQPDPLADAVLRPARADRVDDPGAVLMRDLETVDGPGVAPPRLLTSVGLTPDTWTRTRTSPGPGSGRSISTTRNTSAAGPVRS